MNWPRPKYTPGYKLAQAKIYPGILPPGVYSGLLHRVLKVYEKRKSITRTPAARRYDNPECLDPNDLSGFFKHKKDMFRKGISCLFEVVDNENVPKIEREFLVDQRTVRKMTISRPNTVDKEATRTQQQRE